MRASPTTQAGPTRTRVFLVAEHVVLRQNLELLLEAEGMVLCGSAGEAATALRAMPTETDLVIVVLPDGRPGGVELVRALATRPGSPPELVVSPADDDYSIRQAMAAGARGYVPSRKASVMLPQAIREVIAGRTWVPQPLTGEV